MEGNCKKAGLVWGQNGRDGTFLEIRPDGHPRKKGRMRFLEILWTISRNHELQKCHMWRNGPDFQIFLKIISHF
jgi:hypothetical protein